LMGASAAGSDGMFARTARTDFSSSGDMVVTLS
jgi:hypothetical protein